MSKSKTPSVQSEVDEIRNSNDPEIVKLRETYTGTKAYKSPRIVKILSLSKPVEVLTTTPAVAEFESVDIRELLNPKYDTRVLLPEFPPLDDARFSYLIELDTADQLLRGPKEGSQSDKRDKARYVGGLHVFVSSPPMKMPRVEPDKDQAFGPAVLPVTRLLKQLLAEKAKEPIAVRITRTTNGGKAVDDEKPLTVGPVVLAWVES